MEEKETKVLVVKIINELLLADFPTLNEEKINKIASENQVAGKTVAAFAKRLQKFYEVVSKNNNKKGVDDKLTEKIREVATLNATKIATNLFEADAVFKYITVDRVTKKGNANGKAFFTIEKENLTQKRYFICWDFRNGELFVGSTLHKETDEMKN